MILLACSAAPSARPGSTPERQIELAVSRDLANGEKDPYFAHSSLQVWESLVALDDTLQPVPQLAERWDLSADGTTWTFNLRKGVTFSDGVPFNADAVITNVQRYIKLSPRPSPFFTLDARLAFGDLAEVTRIDESTVQFRHNTPNPSMIYTMSNFFSAMFSPNSFAENGDFTGIPAATGPFVLKQWERGQSLLLERREGYWGTAAKSRLIRLRIMPDSGARVSALVAGEIDGIVELGALLPAQALSLAGHEGITVAADPISISQYLAFNTSKPPFDNVDLRRAVAMMVNREGIVKNLVLGFAEPGKSLLSPFAPHWISPKGEPSYDPSGAQTMAHSVLGDHRASATLIYVGGAGQARPYKEMAELMQADFSSLGIDLQLLSLDQAAANDRAASGDWNLRFTQQGWANGDPDFIMSNFLRSTGSYNGTNKGGYKNAEVDRLVDQGKVERNTEQRKVTYDRLQEIAAQEVPVTPLYHERSPYAYRDTIGGLSQRITYQPTLSDIYLKK